MAARFVPSFARRIEGLIQSDIRRMTRECEKAGGINLGQGICDQPTPDPIKTAAMEAIGADRNIYSKFEGIDPLREAIARKMAACNGIACDPASEVVVTVGSTGGFAVAALALLEAGDEAILFSPYYSYHANILSLCGARLRFVPLRPPGWEIDERELEAAFTPATRAIVINTPSNPSGKVFTREELERIARLCRDRGVVAVTDEIYECILYDGRRHVSLGSLPGMEDLTITLSGFSKTYSMTGWRLGYAVAERRLASRLGLLNDLLYICAPTPLQHAVIAALRLPDSYYDDLRRAYARKRSALAEACSAAGLEPILPQGAYYMLADISTMKAAGDKEAADRLLAEAGVSSVPGSSFYADPSQGRTQLRFCFAKKDADLDEACRRLRAFKA
ncbi:MAG TPA: pyridoxal phosphate-dependent aminotransferase [Candidatus Polarisedimenticolia bacterium]|nr:pyridoxal phosphate-dependent aminotransferase [Candidatus Polarisedimenticolia bacterium]